MNRLEPPVPTLSLPAVTLVAWLVLMLAWPEEAIAKRRGPKRLEPITMVVIHSTGGPTCDASTGRPIWVRGGEMASNMRHIEAHPRLGIHYMIDRDGAVRTSVPEDEVAHHVFRHSARSLAVELINDGDGVDPFPAAQVDALVALLRDIVRRRSISPQGVVRHADLDHGVMACDASRRRKVDPGAAYPHEAVIERVFGR